MRIPTLIVLAAAASQLGSTDCGNALKDTGFDLWCGDQLCAWKIERGSISKVATWNQGDPGVELVGADAAIEQLSPVDSRDGTCIQFTMIANVEDNADVELDVDVFGDGTIDSHERLPNAKWKPLTFNIFIPAPYAGVRFELAKTGAGKAQLANIGAKIADGACDGLAPITVGKAPLGSPCSGDNFCQSGICSVSALPPPFHVGIGGVCVACDSAHPCATDQVCASDVPVSPVRAVPTMCEPKASLQLGEQCSTDAQCSTGICEIESCSTCRSGQTCANGAACKPAWSWDLGLFSPWLCGPGLHAGLHGDPCASDDDCQSSQCDGVERRQCDKDGRACANDDNCPFSGLNNSACTDVGIQGGSCR